MFFQEGLQEVSEFYQISNNYKVVTNRKIYISNKP